MHSKAIAATGIARCDRCRGGLRPTRSANLQSLMGEYFSISLWRSTQTSLTVSHSLNAYFLPSEFRRNLAQWRCDDGLTRSVVVPTDSRANTRHFVVRPPFEKSVNSIDSAPARIVPGRGAHEHEVILKTGPICCRLIRAKPTSWFKTSRPTSSIHAPGKEVGFRCPGCSDSRTIFKEAERGACGHVRTSRRRDHRNTHPNRWIQKCARCAGVLRRFPTGVPSGPAIVLTKMRGNRCSP